MDCVEHHSNPTPLSIGLGEAFAPTAHCYDCGLDSTREIVVSENFPLRHPLAACEPSRANAFDFLLVFTSHMKQSKSN